MLGLKRRGRMKTIVKSVLSLLFGLFMRILWENLWDKSLCQDCPKPCTPCQPYSISMPVDENVAQKYIPKGMYEITRWYYFDDNYLYDIINEKPKVPLIGQWKEETQAVTQIALEYININKMMGRTWKLLKRENGYIQSDVKHGTEYVIDLKVKSMQDDVEETFRTTIVHPLESTYEVESFIQDTQHQIQIIIPLSGDLTYTMETLNNFKEVKLEHICLTLILFTGNGMWGYSFDETILTHIDKWKMENNNLCIKVETATGDYNYARALRTVSSSFDDNSIVLTLKDDMEFSPDVVESCRSIAVPQKRVFIPLAFAQHDPINIERGMPVGKPKNINKKDINKFTGHWLYQVHDFVCAYAADFDNVLRKTLSEAPEKSNEIYFETSEYGTDMYNAFLSKGIKVVSSVEPGLLRYYRNHNCSKIKDATSKRKCVIRHLESGGSKQALNILYLTENASKMI